MIYSRNIDCQMTKILVFSLKNLCIRFQSCTQVIVDKWQIGWSQGSKCSILWWDARRRKLGWSFTSLWRKHFLYLSYADWPFSLIWLDFCKIIVIIFFVLTAVLVLLIEVSYVSIDFTFVESRTRDIIDARSTVVVISVHRVV